MSPNDVNVPRRWVDEAVLALDAATRINERMLRTGRVEGLNNGNHDRLIREAAAWSPYASGVGSSPDPKNEE